MQVANTVFDEKIVAQPDGVTPAGRMAALFLAGMQQGAAVPVEVGVPFTLVPIVAGTYTVQVSRVSTEGDAVAPAAESAPFVITPDQLMMSVPFSVTVTLADPVSVPSTVTVVPTAA